MLQQLLLSTHHPVPAFSPLQIGFLAHHISMAFSQATPEEIIHFNCPATDEQSFRVQGTLAVFSPTILLLTLKDLKDSPEMSSKMQHSSRKLQTKTSLTFSHQEAILKTEEAQAFMTIPPTTHRIALNYERLGSLNPNNKENQLNPHGTQTTSDEKIEAPMARDSLKIQLRELRKIVDQQAEEIRRLQRSSSP